jgi:SAM-dependent methyltransferase
MAKQGEIDYASNLGELGRWHALNKPFSDPNCAGYLMRIASVMELLPPPPAYLLDAGCGAGWTSEFLARRGYRVVGVDIAPDAIGRAEQRREQGRLDNLSFLVSDFESLPFRERFHAALFFDSLHHAVDEELALTAVYKALRPGGWLITSEPGKGHSHSDMAVGAVTAYHVTEKDMPPGRIIGLGRRVGFREFRVYPHADALGRGVYGRGGGLAGRWQWLRRLTGLLRLARTYSLQPWSTGMVVLVK